ncbi:MAG: hypothetical protein ACJAT0_000160 [Nonlabens sp.]|uniref:CCC motif membrane protein n=1 Tax=Nonlabens sp. TaxID=1888209 RepID=UPI0039E496C1
MEQNNPNYKNQTRPPGNSGQQQNQGNYQFPYQGEKLPGDPSAISLGIVSLVLLFIGCLCYGIPAVITLIFSIIGLVIANKNLKTYHADPTKYSQSSLKSINIGKILSIIGVALSSVVCLILLIIALFFGSILAAAMDGEFDTFKGFENQQNESISSDKESPSEEEWKYDDEEELDSLETETDSVLQIEEISIENVIEK